MTPRCRVSLLVAGRDTYPKADEDSSSTRTSNSSSPTASTIVGPAASPRPARRRDSLGRDTYPTAVDNTCSESESPIPSNSMIPGCSRRRGSVGRDTYTPNTTEEISKYECGESVQPNNYMRSAEPPRPPRRRASPPGRDTYYTPHTEEDITTKCDEYGDSVVQDPASHRRGPESPRPLSRASLGRDTYPKAEDSTRTSAICGARPRRRGSLGRENYPTNAEEQDVAKYGYGSVPPANAMPEQGHRRGSTGRVTYPNEENSWPIRSNDRPRRRASLLGGRGDTCSNADGSSYMKESESVQSTSCSGGGRPRRRRSVELRGKYSNNTEVISSMDARINPRAHSRSVEITPLERKITPLERRLIQRKEFLAQAGKNEVFANETTVYTE
jgi:hypothetical protein